MKTVVSTFDGKENSTMPTCPGEVVLHFPTHLLGGASRSPAGFWILDHHAEFGMTSRLAARNVRDFDGMGLDLFIPWMD